MAQAISEEPSLTPRQFKRLMSQAMRDSVLRRRFFRAIQAAGEAAPRPDSTAH